MRHPFERWPASGRRAGLAASAVVFVGLGAALLWVGSELGDDDLLDLQRTGSRDRVVEIVEGWESEGNLGTAGFGLGLDMAYPLAYGCVMAGLAAAAALRARARDRSRAATTGSACAWAAWTAAALDLVENSLQVPMLSDPRAGVPGAVVAFSSAKYVLLVLAIVGTAAVALASRRPRRLPTG